MSEQKFTAGEWELTEDGLGIKAGHQYIAVMANILPSESKANAQLIAAAPKLLEALKNILEELDGESTTSIYKISKLLVNATEAIVKATGGK